VTFRGFSWLTLAVPVLATLTRVACHGLNVPANFSAQAGRQADSEMLTNWYFELEPHQLYLRHRDFLEEHTLDDNQLLRESLCSPLRMKHGKVFLSAV
jgi:hypothetical protein